MIVSDCVAYGAVKYPDRPAIHFQGKEATYRELNHRVRQVANAFGALAEPGDRIAILSQNRPEYVECLYGVPLAGMALCLLNYRLNPRELARIIVDAEPTVLVVERQFVSAIAEYRTQFLSVEHVVVLDGAPDGVTISYEQRVRSASAVEPVVEVDEHSLAWLIYTSGTTGMPKGAMLSHRNILAAAANVGPQWSAHGGSVLLAPWPMCHVAAMIWPSAHVLGWSVVLMRSFDPVGYLQHIEQYHCTTALGAPTMIDMLLTHPQFTQFDLSSLRVVSYGSAAIPTEVLGRAMAALPSVGWENNYGMSELSGSVAYLDAQSHKAALADGSEVLTSVGYQLPFAVCRIVDEGMRDVAVGQVGEVVVRGPQVTGGYWRRPEANEEAFRGGWFHTGDLGKWDSAGRLYIVDRKKDMIITGGENVYSREVEDVLISHPAVAEVAVIGIPDRTWGENVVAVVRLEDGMAATEEELIAHCRASLAGYKKPSQVLFATSLPRNTTGKLIKGELRRSLLDSSGLPEWIAHPAAPTV